MTNMLELSRLLEVWFTEDNGENCQELRRSLKNAISAPERCFVEIGMPETYLELVTTIRKTLNKWQSVVIYYKVYPS